MTYILLCLGKEIYRAVCSHQLGKNIHALQESYWLISLPFIDRIWNCHINGLENNCISISQQKKVTAIDCTDFFLINSTWHLSFYLISLFRRWLPSLQVVLTNKPNVFSCLSLAQDHSIPGQECMILKIFSGSIKPVCKNVCSFLSLLWRSLWECCKRSTSGLFAL